MYTVLKNHLTYGTYYLDDAMARIDYAVARGLTNVDEATELTSIAEKNASAPSALEAEMAALKARVSAMEAERSASPAISGEESAESGNGEDIGRLMEGEE